MSTLQLWDVDVRGSTPTGKQKKTECMNAFTQTDPPVDAVWL